MSLPYVALAEVPLMKSLEVRVLLTILLLCLNRVSNLCLDFTGTGRFFLSTSPGTCG